MVIVTKIIINLNVLDKIALITYCVMSRGFVTVIIIRMIILISE